MIFNKIDSYIKENKAFYRNVKLIPWACLMGLFLIYCVFISLHSMQLLDSDMSSEMVLSKLLSEENRIVTPNWIYSTALNVLNTQIIYSFFFNFTNSWHVVRVCASITMMILMLASYYYLLRQLKSEKYFPLTASILVMPFSSVYFEIVLHGMYYTPHITFTFMLLGAVFHYRNAKSSAAEKIILSCAFIFAFIVGLGGLRPLFITALPLVCVAFAAFMIELFEADRNCESCNIKVLLGKSNVKLIISSIVITVGCLLGYIVNSVYFSKIYRYSPNGNKFGNPEWTNISEYFFDILNGVFTCYGYQTGKLISDKLIHNAICFVVIAFLFGLTVSALKNREKYTTELYYAVVFMASSVVLTFVLYEFTSMIFMDRYFLTATIMFVPVLAVFSRDYINGRDTGAVRSFIGLVAICVFAGMILCSYLTYRDYYRKDDTLDFRQMIGAVSEQGYTDGYAEFWSANVVTELSDGAIDMYAWDDDIDIIFEGNTYEWLEKVSHTVEKPEGKVFLLLHQGMYVNSEYLQKLPKDRIIYESGYTIAFGFDSFDEMCCIVDAAKH